MALLDWIFSFRPVIVALALGVMTLVALVVWMPLCRRVGRRGLPAPVAFSPVLLFIAGGAFTCVNPIWVGLGHVQRFTATRIYGDVLLGVDYQSTMSDAASSHTYYRLHGVDLKRGSRLHRQVVGNEVHLGPSRRGAALLHSPGAREATVVDLRTGRRVLTLGPDTLEARGGRWAAGIERVTVPRGSAQVVVTTRDGRTHRIDPFAMAGRRGSPPPPSTIRLRYQGLVVQQGDATWLRLEGPLRRHLAREGARICPELSYLHGAFLAAAPARQMAAVLDYQTTGRSRFSVVGVRIDTCKEVWRVPPQRLPDGGDAPVTVRGHRHGDNLIVVARGRLLSVRLVDGTVNWTLRE